VFKDAPPFQIDFTFANATFHPMFTVLLISQLAEWRWHFDQVEEENPKMFRSMMYWAWRYLCDTSASVDSYSSARQVRVIANRVTRVDRLDRFRKYVEKKVKADMGNYPNSVQSFYARS
jgi:hypothetical protein